MLVRNAVRLRLVCFKQKTAYEMRISDWSSDVCSSDLNSANGPCRAASTPQLSTASIAPGRARSLSTSISRPRPARRTTTVSDRKRVVSGKSVAVRVALGGRRLINKNIDMYHDTVQHHLINSSNNQQSTRMHIHY